MSRSRRKTPICGIAGSSDKEGKRLANRKFRRKEKEALKECKEPPKDLNEVSDVWSFNKDGKKYYSREDCDNYDDEEYEKRIMRK